MSSITRRVAAAALIALSLTATACGPTSHPAPMRTSAAGGRSTGTDDWTNWLNQHPFTDQPDQNDWSTDQQMAATSDEVDASGLSAAAQQGVGQSDPPPPAKRAEAAPHPYATNLAPLGKIFFVNAQGQQRVCSGTVVQDPARPGRSNLVWTAGHCVYAVAGGWNKRVMFIPWYNRSGAGSSIKNPTTQQIAPLGRWWADKVAIEPQWAAEGTEHQSGPQSQYDSAIIRVTPETATGKSLEETVGGAVPIWFNAPREQLSQVTEWGYPADPPYNGRELYYCTSGMPGRYSIDPSRPTMYRVGCSMTGGSSGGAWLGTMPNGRTGLVSNVSLGQHTLGWQAGPELETQAQQMLAHIDQMQ